MKGLDKILKSDRGYVSCIAVIVLCSSKKLHSGILKLFEGNFHQGIKLHIIYFGVNDIKVGLSCNSTVN